MTNTPQEDPQTHPASTPEEDAPEIVPGEKPEDDEPRFDVQHGDEKTEDEAEEEDSSLTD